jgi:hypothetical protein
MKDRGEGFEDEKIAQYVHMCPPASTKRNMGELVFIVGGMCTTPDRVVALLPI